MLGSGGRFGLVSMVLKLHAYAIMLTVGLTEAKRRFEELVERAVQGELIRITRYGKPKADMVGAEANRRKPRVNEKTGKRSRK